MAEFGWAYVVGSQAGGVSGSVQTARPDLGLTGSNTLIYDHATDTLTLTGSMFVSGSITANQFNVNVVNETVTNLSASGNTKFGNSTDDTHIFTGSVAISSSASPLNIKGVPIGAASSSNHYLALDTNYNLVLTSAVGSIPGQLIDEYTNPGNNRIITSIDASGINAEANLTFDGSLMSVTGAISSSVGISSSIGQFSQLTGANLQSTTITATNIGGTLTTPAQSNITSLGTLSALNVSGDVSASALFVSSSNRRVGIGTNSPEKKLEVYSKDDQLRLTYSKYIPFLESNVHTDLLTNSDGYLILSSSGQRVGIGTESPTRMLDVNGDVRVGGNLEITGTLSAKVSEFVVSANNITFGDSAADSLTFNASSGSVPNGLNLDSNTWVLDSANNRIGIGAEHPIYTLDVKTTNSSAFRIKGETNGIDVNCGIENTGTDADDGALLAITAQAGAGDPALRFAIPATETWSMGIDNSDNDKFKISQNSTLHTDTRLTIAGGSIGIGTSAPEAKLHVAGDCISTGNLGVTGSITGSSITDGTAVMTGGNINNINTLTATNLGGTLTTAAQPNVTSVGTLASLAVSGDLTVDTDVLKVNSTTNKVGIGRTDPVRKLDVLSTDPQLRLAYSKYILGVSSDVHSDIFTTSGGHLILSSSSQRVGIGTNSPTKMLDVEGDVRIGGSLVITGSLHARVSEFIVDANNITFGDSATDTLIFNAASGTIMNGLNLDGGTLVIDSDNNRVGIGEAFPNTKMHIKSSTLNQLKLAYNDSVHSTLTTKANGHLNITPTGNYITASSGLKVSGSTFLGTLPTHNVVVSGELSASMAISSSVATFSELTSSIITDGTATITGGNISGVNTLTATNLGGTLSTAAQTNITSVGTLSGLSVSGDLNVDSNTLFVKSSNDRVGIGRNDPGRKLEILTTDPQFRLSYSKFVFGASADVFSDIYTDSSGILTLSGSGGKTKIDNNLQITGLSSGTGVTTKYLALDSGNNIILTSSAASGIETRNRRVITADYTLSSDDYYIGVSASTNIVVSLVDASSIPNGQTFTIKDEKGNASSISIKIKASGSQTIDGTGSVSFNANFAALNIYTNGSDKYFIF